MKAYIPAVKSTEMSEVGADGKFTGSIKTGFDTIEIEDGGGHPQTGSNRHDRRDNGGRTWPSWILAILLAVVITAFVFVALWLRSTAMDAQTTADKAVVAASEADKKAEKGVRLAKDAQSTADTARQEVVNLEQATAKTISGVNQALTGRLDKVEETQRHQAASIAAARENAIAAKKKGEELDGRMVITESGVRGTRALIENLGDLQIGVNADNKLALKASGIGLHTAEKPNADGTITIHIGVPKKVAKSADDDKD